MKILPGRLIVEGHGYRGTTWPSEHRATWMVRTLTADETVAAGYTDRDTARWMADDHGCYVVYRDGLFYVVANGPRSAYSVLDDHGATYGDSERGPRGD